MKLSQLPIKIYADGADAEGIRKLNDNPLIQGLTTNPTLMRKAGITDYEAFARQILEFVTEKPISFEVFSDDFKEMKKQAKKIQSWGSNVYVKIPITNSRGESAVTLISDLVRTGAKLNITAILTEEQVASVAKVLIPETPAVVSVFAGRIADTGRDPVPAMRSCARLLEHLPHAELLWASVREVLNIAQAAESGAHIVTVPHDILSKAIKLWDMDLKALSLDTVKMFELDARSAGYKL